MKSQTARESAPATSKQLRELRFLLSPDGVRPLSQQALSNVMGVSLSSVARWEAGGTPDWNSTQRIRRLWRLAEALQSVTDAPHIYMFMTTGNKDLLGLRPIDLLDTEQGCDRVLSMIEKVQTGAFG